MSAAGTTSTSGLLRINNADPVGISVVQNSLTLVDNQNAIAGATFQNLSTGTSADMRFVAANNQGDYLAFFSPGSGNTATLFGQTQSNIGGFFLNGVTDTDKQLAIGTVHTGDILFGIGNAEIGRMSTTNFDYGNYSFNTDQTVGAGQDGYVLTYNNGTGEIELTDNGINVSDGEVAYGDAGALTSTSSFTFSDVDNTLAVGDRTAPTSGKILNGYGNTTQYNNVAMLGSNQYWETAQRTTPSANTDFTALFMST